MNKFKTLTALIIQASAMTLGLSDALSQSAVSKEIPKEFHGHWEVVDSSDCQMIDTGQATLITKDSIAGWEWHDEIKSTQWVQQGTVLDVVSSRCAEGDCEAPSKVTLTLSNNGNALSIGENKYVRCGISNSSATNTSKTTSSVKLNNCDLDSKMVNKVINDSKIDGILDTDYSTCKKLPNSPEITVFAFLTGRTDDDNNGRDLTVVTAKTDSGDIIGTFKNHTQPDDDYFFQHGMRNMLAEIKIDTANYRLNSEKRAFGIVKVEENDPNQTIDLFIQNGNKIEKVIGDLSISGMAIHKFDGDCAGEPGGEWKGIISMSDKMTNGFFDIIFKETIKEYDYGNDTAEQVCSDNYKAKYKTKTEKTTFKYDGKKYVKQ